MKYMGINRRRRDWRGRLRRLAYGVVMAFSATQAPASESQTAGDKTAQQAPVIVEDQQMLTALVLVQGVLAERAQPMLFGASFTRPALGERSERLLSEMNNPVSNGLLRLSFSDDDLRRLKEGIGMDLELPDLGSFHLNLYSRTGTDMPAGKRWELAPNESTHSSARRQWSIGASLDQVRTEEGGRQLVLVPQLVLDAAALLGRKDHFDICIQYAHWRAPGGQAASEQRVPQAVFKWSAF